jgi:nucleotide-binding universal stress UspA family protein
MSTKRTRKKRWKNPEKPRKVDITRLDKGDTPEAKVADAAQKGFGLMFVGIAKSRSKDGELTQELTRIVGDFPGPVAVLVCRDCPDPKFLDGADILVPVNGTDVSRRGAETAFVLARAMNANVTTLYVSAPATENAKQRVSPTRRNEAAVLKDIAQLAQRYDLDIHTAVASNRAADAPIRKEAPKHDLIVMGVSRRPGNVLFFGNMAAALMKDWDGPILFVSF